MKNILINGFGRIGRVITRINAIKKGFNLVKINEIVPSLENMVYLLKYDSSYGKFNSDVKLYENKIIINEEEIAISHKDTLDKISLEEKEVDVIIDCSGNEQNIKHAEELIREGIIKKYVCTHSSDMVDLEVVMGVNDNKIKPEHKTFSNSICDTNAIAHLLAHFEEEFSIINGSVTTLHPFLSYQNLLDGAVRSPSYPYRRNPTNEIGINTNHITENFGLGRSSVDSIIPKATTAVTCAEKIVKEIKGKLISHSYRIPTATVSLADLVLRTEKLPSLSQLQKSLQQLADKNIYVRLNYESLVSKDYEAENSSAVVDMQWLQVNKDIIKVVLWYDNEWGYSSRVLDLVEKLARV